MRKPPKKQHMKNIQTPMMSDLCALQAPKPAAFQRPLDVVPISVVWVSARKTSQAQAPKVKR